jgi:endonuclease I/chitodextrinase
MKTQYLNGKLARVAGTIMCVTSILSSANALADIPANYYNSINTSSPAALKSSLHEIIDDHTRFPYTSSATDTWDILEAADQDPDNANNVIDIYKNASYAKEGGGNTFYNREHSWPKSYGFPSDGSDNYAYTDTHHLFIANSGYNSSRSNKPYANCGASCLEKITEFTNNRGGGVNDSNWTEGSFAQGTWQTWQGRKGDVARALMYMAIRYEGGTHGVTGVSEPDLILTDDRTLIENSNTGSNISVAYMGLRSVLIQWHKDDPVDDFEVRHNDTVYSYQGNRNPFIDHPEYAACVFEGICSSGSGDTTAPGTPIGLSAIGGDNLVELAWTTNNESDLAGYNIYRSDTSGSGFVKVNSGLVNTNAYTDNSLSANSTYYYLVSAVDSSANESTMSSEVSATTNEVTTPPAGTAWINEFHYDNDGSDINEFVEIAGSTGTNLTGWSLVAYNGNGGTVYKTVNLSGTISDQYSGFGVLSFAASGLQNGAPDGIALVNSSNEVVQFLSYEGTLMATDGVASGLTSTDIGVSETSSTPVGYSLQLIGSGQSYSDFTWQVAASHTSDSANTNQTFGGSTPVNELPTAAFTQTCTNLSCNFDATNSNDTDGTISSYSWDFGDGNTAAGVTPVHDYANTGTYTVQLTVTDNSNDIAITSIAVTVTQVLYDPWINEFHYDNKGSDKGEFIEIAGNAGIDLTNWRIEAYNGNDGSVYTTINLSSTISSQQNGYGTLAFNATGLQNGGSDALALIDNNGNVIQFLSYEGTMTATNGAAAGMTSTDIGVAENSSTNRNHSLQLSGSGKQYSDFTWQSPASKTQGTMNNNQTF